MSEPARFEPVLLHREQVSQENQPEKIWLRMKNEPAKWYMRFQVYLNLGPKRSLRAALASESPDGKAAKGNKAKEEDGKKLSDISVPGAWSRASKQWHWQERSQAYDLAQMEIHSSQIRSMVSSAPYASKAYRVLKLDDMARLLRDQIKGGMPLDDSLAVMARYQAILQQIAREMQGLDEATLQVCDASAMLTIRQETLEEECARKLENASYADKLLAQIDYELERRKIEQQRP